MYLSPCTRPMRGRSTPCLCSCKQYTLPVYCMHCFFSERELTFAICCRPSVCRLSVVFNARAPTQAVVVFGNLSTAFVRWPSVDMHRKFYGDRPRGTPRSGELNSRGVAKYSNFGPMEGHISETAQDMR